MKQQAIRYSITLYKDRACTKAISLVVFDGIADKRGEASVLHINEHSCIKCIIPLGARSCNNGRRIVMPPCCQAHACQAVVIPCSYKVSIISKGRVWDPLVAQNRNHPPRGFGSHSLGYLFPPVRAVKSVCYISIA